MVGDSIGSKRSSPESDDHTTTKRRVRHKLHHIQSRPHHVEPAPQDPIFTQGQLLKSISAALVLAGFDSVKPTALEMFRSHVEEYMLRFLTHARVSMQGNRRTTPTALDFTVALADMPTSHTASLLKSQLDVSLPEDISHPTISEPDPAPAPAPDFSQLLKPLIEKRRPTWIPRHFPDLPSQHAWKQTAVFPDRERDARKMREKATEEGMLAEQALRKLAAAHQSSAMNAEKRRSHVLHGEGKMRDPSRPGRLAVRAHEDTFTDVLRDLGGSEDVAMDMGLDETDGRDGVDIGMPEGVLVNHDMNHWRRSGQRRGVRG